MMTFHTMPGTIIGHAAMSERGRRMMQLHGMALPGWAGGIHAYEPAEPEPLAPLEYRHQIGKHEAGHAIISAAYSVPIHEVKVHRSGGGGCESFIGAYCDRVNLDWRLAGPAAVALYTCGEPFGDDPTGRFENSDRAVVNNLLSQIVERAAADSAAFGQRIDLMVTRDREFRESVQRVRCILEANRSALIYIADALATRSEHGGSLTGDDILRFRILPAARCGADLWWMS